MELQILSDTQKEAYRSRIEELMRAADNDFVPPLSKRSSTTQKKLSDIEGDTGDGINKYLSEMMTQSIAAAIENGELMGFVSYKENYSCDAFDEAPNIYLSTLILSDSAKGKGLTKKMYAYLFDEVYSDRSIFTRTWSTNYAHLKILGYFSFVEIMRIENDRADGIDTVYYAKRRRG